MGSEVEYTSYDQVKQRLDSIVEQVNDESISLDDALDLYEEAVKLGMRASEMIEIVAQDDEPEAETADEAADPAAE